MIRRLASILFATVMLTGFAVRATAEQPFEAGAAAKRLVQKAADGSNPIAASPTASGTQSLIMTTLLQGTQAITGQSNLTNFCPAQNVSIPATGVYKVDGTWAGSGGACPHASCIPVIGGAMLDTRTDAWPGIISWIGNWWSSSVHGQVSLQAGDNSVQWQCHFNPACSGTMECYRFAVVLTGPF
jgi:hypothetical protein